MLTKAEVVPRDHHDNSSVQVFICYPIDKMSSSHNGQQISRETTIANLNNGHNTQIFANNDATLTSNFLQFLSGTISSVHSQQR